MRPAATILALVLMGAAAPPVVHAQFAGRWTVELGEWQTDDGAGLQIRGANSGQLELTLKGDSVVGTWVAAHGNPTPLELRGRIEGGKVVLKGTREGRVNLNGQESTVMLGVEYELRPSEDGLTGVMRLKQEGAPPVWRSLKARRAA